MHMTAFDPDTRTHDQTVLRDMVKQFGGKLTLNSEVRCKEGPLRSAKALSCAGRPVPPARVKVLFVGESPPASGRNFYRADSGLYRAIREAFLAVDARFDTGDFLAAFLNAGCYLIDLCPEPVDRLHTRDRQVACHAGEAQLAEAISGLRPGSVITLVRSIEANVARALEKARWNGPTLSLPYPGRWASHKTVFASSLRVTLPGLLNARPECGPEPRPSGESCD
jgi:hypothetical protein